ncbi:hypothetical protein P152DRAFT_100933 [Eremomyces bilateralis CBS 781.70]|uniref:FAD-binding domain-containing protein n=1 Tax=Eremomyces bilateralis CBS 781.70 TaxID=1392243 RepID=A0A6G1FXV3_9PEZI|nr:uncharacterized protein P152DRAFT_100933 [Eremomyces bilateralis CBS 781.70]KAF1810520.1 hypothetical protein P152DRAFT_100933 [Eremomyces bilateralis CBS 781.70]
MVAHFDQLRPRDERLLISPPQMTNVLVVGCGPTGLVTAVLFANQGASCAIVERHASQFGEPKAHVINARSLEILRHAGIDVAALTRQEVSSESGDKVGFLTNLTREQSAVCYTNDKKKPPRPWHRSHYSTSHSQSLNGRWKRRHWLPAKSRSIGGRIGLAMSSITTSLFKVLERDPRKETIIELTCVIGADGTNSAVRTQISGMTFDTIDSTKSPMNYISLHCSVDIESFMEPLVNFTVEKYKS